jgi:hypothetical protein
MAPMFTTKIIIIGGDINNVQTTTIDNGKYRPLLKNIPLIQLNMMSLPI